MTERIDDRGFGALEADLRHLATELAYPAPGPGFAATVVRAIADRPPRPWWARLAGPRQSRGPMVRRSVLLAAALLLLTVAIAAAIAFGVPGIRIVFGPAPSGTPSQSAPNATPTAGLPTFLSIFLGDRVETAEIESLVGFAPRLPTDPAIGPPDRAYVDNGRLSLVWETSSGLPETESRGIGLLITEFRGDVDPGWYEKLLHTGATTVEHVEVDGHEGNWIAGDPHNLSYIEPDGDPAEESRRVVGDVLIWNDGLLTYRLETSLGRDAAIRIAETLE